VIDWILDGGFLADVAWQTTLFLALGCLGAHLLSRRPARAHWFLTLCLVAAIATPLASALVRQLDLGWFEGAAASPAAASASAAELSDPILASRWTTEARLALAWSLASGLLLVRLMWVAHRSRRWLRRIEGSSRAADAAPVRTAAQKLGVRGLPRVRITPAVDTPAIWCWSRTPLVLLPEQDLAPSTQVRVLCHELAHWKRRDHWFDLFSSLFVAALPWHPLAWLTRRKLALLSERACDRWVLATGETPVDYAETLLDLVPQRIPARVLCAVSKESGLVSRVRDILHADPAPPRIGRRAALAASLWIGLGATALAFAQESRPAPAPIESSLSVTLVSADLETPVTFAPRELDLGTTTPGLARSAAVRLVHRGTRPRAIEKVTTSCGCTTATPDVEGRVLQPGESLELVITMNPSDQIGDHKTKDVTIAIEGQDLIRLPVHLRTVRPEE